MRIVLSKSLGRVVPQLERLLYLLRHGTPQEKRQAEKTLRFAERYGHNPRKRNSE